MTAVAVKKITQARKVWQRERDSIDVYKRQALQEDITSEDVSTNAVMPTVQMGEVELIAKEDGVIAGLDVYARVFELLDEKTVVTFYCKDGDVVTCGQRMATVHGDIRVLLSGERVASVSYTHLDVYKRQPSIIRLKIERLSVLKMISADSCVVYLKA